MALDASRFSTPRFEPYLKAMVVLSSALRVGRARPPRVHHTSLVLSSGPGELEFGDPNPRADLY